MRKNKKYKKTYQSTQQMPLNFLLHLLSSIHRIVPIYPHFTARHYTNRHTLSQDELTRTGTTSGAVLDVRMFEKYPPFRIAVVALAVEGELEYELVVFAVAVVAVSRGASA